MLLRTLIPFAQDQVQIHFYDAHTGCEINLKNHTVHDVKELMLILGKFCHRLINMTAHEHFKKLNKKDSVLLVTASNSLVLNNADLLRGMFHIMV
jgi:hypothetical protein